MPSNTVLDANGLVRCKESNVIYCSICTTNTRLDAWEKHIGDPTHVETVEKFNLMFEKKDSKVHCRQCNEDFDWQVLKNHARSHMILPWYRPDDKYDKYKIFFENRIFEWKSQFHCCICDATFSKCDIAFAHITDLVHQGRIEKIALSIYEFPTDTISYDFLVSECLIASTETALECRICGCTKVCLDSIGRHVRGLMHKSNKSKFCLKFNDQKATECITELINEYFQSEESVSDDSGSEVSTSEKAEAGISTDNRTNVCQSSACNYIMKHSETDSYCIICNCLLFHHSINNHIKEKDHVDAKKEYGCDAIFLNNESEYYCKICDRKMFGLTSVYSHVLGRKHFKSLNASRQERFRKGLNEIDTIKQQEEAIKEVSELERSYQAKSLGKSTNDNISMLEDDVYYCRCCNVVIPSPENLYLHLKEEQHLRLLSVSQVEKTLDKVNPAKKTAISCFKEVNPHFNGESLSFLDLTQKQPLQMRPDSLESLRRSNVDFHTKEESFLSLPNTSGKQQVQLRTGSLETPKRPEVNFHTKSERRPDSLNKSDNRQVISTPGPLKILRRPQHIPEPIFERSSCNYLARLNDTDFHCKVCDCVITGSSLNIYIHVTGSYHAESLKKYCCDYISLKGGNICHCECCDLAMVHLENVYQHIKKDNHMNFVAEMSHQQLPSDKKSSKKVEVPKLQKRLNESACQTSPSIYILPQNATVSHCVICDMNLFGRTEILDHIAGIGHGAAMEKHGCDRVLLEGGDNYYCTCCKCKISGSENVCSHVKGRRHFFALHHQSDQQQLRTVKKNLNELKTLEKPDLHTAFSAINTEISKMLIKLRRMESKSRQNDEDLE